MLWLLIESGVTVVRFGRRQPPVKVHGSPMSKTENFAIDESESGVLPQLALPQIVLAAAAITSFHVQVINRLSSGYPIWYLAVADRVVTESSTKHEKKLSQWIIRGMVLYAMTQGMLFACFLPPA